MSCSDHIAEFVRRTVNFEIEVDLDRKYSTITKICKVFSLLPENDLALFIDGQRNLRINFKRNLQIPLGMSTSSAGVAGKRTYQIVAYDEQQDIPEDLFIGSLLRELALVVLEIPPISEWPPARGDKARYKERMEYMADATVWKWGLRHYSIRHITSTYPAHWADTIIKEISRIMVEEREKLH
jgi:hypothetical protein